MKYPIDRKECKRVLSESISEKEKALSALELALVAFDSFKRKNADVYLCRHIESLAPCRVTIARPFSSIEVRFYPNNDHELREIFYFHSAEMLAPQAIRTELAKRIDGIKEELANAQALLPKIDTLADEYDALASKLEAITSLPAMYIIRSEFKTL